MSSISYSHANARLSYSLRGSHIAKLRCRQLTHSYGVQGAESHAKRFRAFYPFQRVQGNFSMVFEFIHHDEYKRAMDWFRDYIEAVIEQRNPSYMQVQLDARNFLRLGYPTTGVTFGDHTGSMVFAPTISFISVADPRDSKSGIKSLNQSASRDSLPQGQTSTNWFYPTSRFNQPGAMAAYIYNAAAQAAAAAAAEIQDLVQPAPNPILSRPIVSVEDV